MTKAKRTSKASNSVKKSVVVASPFALAIGAALNWAQAKYQIDPQLMTVGASILGSLGASLVAYKSKGGRQGEAD